MDVTSLYEQKRPRDYHGKPDETMIGAKSKVGRTAVYAGHSRKLSHVPRLEDMCINVLMDHVDRIHEFGDVPYFIMKPILEKCSLENLQRIEKLNPVCIPSTLEQVFILLLPFLEETCDG